MFNAFSIVLVVAFLLLPVYSSIRLILRKDGFWKSWGKWFLLCSVGCYFLLLFSAKSTDLHFERRLNEYDLDGNGMFSGSEITPQMETAMSDLTNDTGRSLAPITGLLIAPFYCGFWHVLIGLPYLLFRRSHR